ncbi:MAG: hypothetical protein GWO24_07135, partial [Akkermansiaceae bacterium]|nr:hypothetical protein [Akkermansiaceae bacterium]
DYNAPFIAAVYSSIPRDLADTVDVKFQTVGYVEENTRKPPEHFLQLSGAGDHLRT